MATKNVSKSALARRTIAKIADDFLRIRDELRHTLPHVEGSSKTPPEAWQAVEPNLWAEVRDALPNADRDQLAHVCYYLYGLAHAVANSLVDSYDVWTETLCDEAYSQVVDTNLELVKKLVTKVTDIAKK